MNATDPFEAIVSEHYESLFRFAMSLTRAEPDARDLTQQTFYVWATKGHQLRNIAMVKSWLFTTMHRAFLAARRKQSQFAQIELETVADELQVPCKEYAADQVDCSLVLSALAKVDEVYQTAVALFYLEDYSYREIATILDIPVGTVKSRLARGIAQLKALLWVDSPDGFSPGRNENAARPEYASMPRCAEVQLVASADARTRSNGT